MCARYYMDSGLYDDIEPLVGRIPEERRYQGDVRPSDMPLVITADKEPKAAYDIAWGYPRINGKGLIINARAETIEEKATFRNGIARNRCLLPSRSFYEWDSEKNKVAFSLENSKPLFLAGCYDDFKGGRHFTIITTAANESVISVHERMPLIIREDDIEEWLLTERYNLLFKKPMPELNVYRAYEQLQFDF